MTNFTGLRRAVENAKIKLKLIKEKYPELEMYLVFSSNLGQVGINSSFEEILGTFPAMILDDKEKMEALLIKTRIRDLEEDLKRDEKLKKDPATQLKMKSLKEDLSSYSEKVNYNEHVNIELRFVELKFDTIRKLQVDELVDKKLTPQGESSIRIVLGDLRNV